MRFQPMISSRGTTAKAAASGSCPSTRAPLRVSPAGTSLLLPPLQISIPGELLPSPLPAPLPIQHSLFAGARNFREKCLIPWGSASVELSREQPLTEGEGGRRRREEEEGGRRKGFLYPTEEPPKRSQVLFEWNGDFLRVYFQCCPAWGAGGVGGSQPWPALPQLCMHRRSLSWHSADREGKSFSCAKQRGEGAFLCCLLNATHPWPRGVARGSEQSRHERQRGRQGEKKLSPSHESTVASWWFWRAPCHPRRIVAVITPSCV